jgi:hypothetical protein
MTILTQHSVRISRSGLPALLFCAAWTNHDKQTMAEAWLALPARNTDGHSSFRWFAMLEREVDEAELLAVVQKRAEQDIWKQIEAEDASWYPENLKFDKLTLDAAKTWRSLASVEGLNYVIGHSNCPEAAESLRALPRGFRDLYQVAEAYPQGNPTPG